MQNGKQAGPVLPARLAELVRAGTVTADTLVWRQGMSQWQPYNTVPELLAGAPPSAPGNVVCSECGRSFPPSEVISYGGFWVCAACKPLFFQRIKEGVKPAGVLVWRSKKDLVVSHGAEMPDRCVRCNAPAQGRRLKRRLYWHHPAIYLLILCSLLIYIIVALVVRKRAEVEIGLCQQHLVKRKRDIALSWALAILGVALIVGSISFENGWAGLAGGIVLLGALIYAAVATPIVSAKRIDKDHLWMRGACREFLESFPEWNRF